MVFYFIILGMLGILFLLSGQVEITGEKKVPAWKLPFFRSASFLRNKLSLAGGPKEDLETEKLADALLILFLGLGITLLIQIVMPGAEELPGTGQLSRPEKGEGNLTWGLQAEIEGLEGPEDISVEVGERELTDGEKQQLLERAAEELDQIILGENPSPDEVRGQIELPSELFDGRITVQWIREPEKLVDETGLLSEDIPGEGAILQLKAILICEDREWICERALHVYPPVRTEREELLYQLRKAVKEADEATAEESELTLPLEVEGKKVSWRKSEISTVGICLAVTLLAAAAMYLAREQEYRKKEKERARQLLMDYPGLLFQLSLLLEAGLTMQNAFSRIAMGYRDQRHPKKRAVYEEMLAACYEMQSGIPEREAYEAFGKRCGETCYVKLGTMLASGLQKGSQGLTEVLQKEAREAMDTRRQLARKLGEEAGTKLLLPMILMLIVVMVILMVPAVMAF